ncbi:vesicle transport protein SFT2B isoform X2 [Homalodisca vitripennis]|uniref:Vesicle transport protein n=1 Tax=Homalodisca liturata TaxID=320908 RepID=A0A1B6HE67_9HEMI|nr:vesicle transport protein SFT2B isoform X2 [Homalodisca vitripennis]
MDKLRRALAGDDGRDDDSTTGIIPNFDTTTLSWSTRIKCFAFCFILGILLSMLASLSLFLHRGWAQFAVLYTFGNIVSMLSTLFLMGPVNQVKKMFAPTRVVATIVVIVMIVLTLVSGFWIKNAGLAFLFIIMQWMAMTWYSLSYIPYARDAVKKTVETCIA